MIHGFCTECDAGVDCRGLACNIGNVAILPPGRGYNLPLACAGCIAALDGLDTLYCTACLQEEAGEGIDEGPIDLAASFSIAWEYPFAGAPERHRRESALLARVLALSSRHVVGEVVDICGPSFGGLGQMIMFTLGGVWWQASVRNFWRRDTSEVPELIPATGPPVPTVPDGRLRCRCACCFYY
jgi:hypothetical protein